MTAMMQSISFQSAQVARWSPADYAGAVEAPLIDAAAARPILAELDLWDSWPLAHEDGRTVVHAGRQWWFFLSAPRLADPGGRHDIARIRLVSLGGEGWQDHGDVLDPAMSPGSREWAGSAVLADDGSHVTLYFTAAGRRDAPASFEQRIFAVDGVLGDEDPGHWGAARELVQADGRRYVRDGQVEGRPGEIKGFRDPAWFRDPATGKAHLLFTASAGWNDDPHNGVIGLATLGAGGWTLDDPLVEAIGVNNELERPHVVMNGGRYYLFWSTQRRTFAPGAVAGPNGLYAMVADALDGPWRPVNRHGLVVANPGAEPTQAYSWWVTGEGDVWSFVDHWGLAGRSFEAHPELLRAQFGGTPAPRLRLAFADDRVTLAL